MALPNSPEAWELMRGAIRRYLELPADERAKVYGDFMETLSGRKWRDAIAVPCDTATSHRTDRAGP